MKLLTERYQADLLGVFSSYDRMIEQDTHLVPLPFAVLLQRPSLARKQTPRKRYRLRDGRQ
jgi:capsular polysaccharide biosynthesis protein